MRKVKVCFIFLLLFILTFTLISVKASSSSDLNLPFSSYVNLLKDDIFDKEIEINTLYKKSKYNIGNRYVVENKKNLKNPNGSTNKDIGFSVDNEFYGKSYTLTELGKHKISVYLTKEEDNILKRIGNPIETFYIYMKDKQSAVVQNRDTLYKEVFFSSKDAYTFIENSFSGAVDISNKTEIMSAIENNSDTIIVKIGNQEYTFKNINLPSSTTINKYLETNKLKFISLNTKSEVIRPLTSNEVNIFEWLRDRGSLHIKEVIDEFFTSKGYNATYEATSEQLEDKIFTNEGYDEENIIKYTIYIEGTNIKITDIVKRIKLYKTNYELTFVKNNIPKEMNYNPDYNFSNELFYTYAYVHIDSIDWIDLLATYDIVKDLNNEVGLREYKVEYKTIGINSQVYKTTLEGSIDIIDNLAPKILSRYNYLIIDEDCDIIDSVRRSLDKNDKLYQIAIIDNYKLDTTSIEYEYDSEYNRVIIKAKDIYGNEATKIIDILFKEKQQKGFIGFMKNYGLFIKKIFNIK